MLSTAQKVGLGVVGVGVVIAAVSVMNSKAAAAALPAPGGTSASSYWLFNVTTPYTSQIATNPTGTATVATALAGAGFTNITVQSDPTTTNGWVVLAMYPGTPPATVAAASGNLTLTPPDGSTAIPQVTSLPTQTTANLQVGTWYSFSVRTSFLQTSLDAQSAVAVILTGLGFGTIGSTATAPLLFITPAADLSSAPDTWNVYAMVTGTTSPVPANGTPITIVDLPPLLFFVPSALPTALATAPTTAPPNTMP